METPEQSFVMDFCRLDGEGCWVWFGPRSSGGYGIARFGGKAWAAHRLSYSAFVGPIPSGLVVHHECFNRSCCNPDHLMAVTPAENAKIRSPRKWVEIARKNPTSRSTFQIYIERAFRARPRFHSEGALSRDLHQSMWRAWDRFNADSAGNPSLARFAKAQGFAPATIKKILGRRPPSAKPLPRDHEAFKALVLREWGVYLNTNPTMRKTHLDFSMHYLFSPYEKTRRILIAAGLEGRPVSVSSRAEYRPFPRNLYRTSEKDQAA